MLVMNPGFFVPVYLLVAKVQYIFQTTDGYARFLIRRHKNKGRERLRVGELASGMAEAEDVGAASRPCWIIYSLAPIDCYIVLIGISVVCSYFQKDIAMICFLSIAKDFV